MVEAGVDGLLLAPTTATADHADPAWYEDLGIPLVLVERRPRPVGPPVEHVVTDHAHGARLAVHHLAAQGRRRIALLTRHGTPPPRCWRRASAPAWTWRACAHPRTPGTWTSARATPAPGIRRRDGTLPGRGRGRSRRRGRRPPRRRRARPPPTPRRPLAHRPRRRGPRVVRRRGGRPRRPALERGRPSKHEVGVCAVELLSARITAPDRPRRQVSILPELRVRASSAARTPPERRPPPHGMLSSSTSARSGLFEPPEDQ